MNVKDYAKEFTKAYSGALKRLQNKYDAMTGALDEEYNARNHEINENEKKAKNAASASHKIDLENSRRSLLDRGLATSGESVNTEIRANLSKNRAFSEIASDAEKSRRENALSKSREKSALIAKRLEEENALERDMAKSMLEQANTDREFDLKERQNASDEEQRAFENQLKEKQFASDEEQRAFNNSMKEREYASDKEQKAFDNSMKEKDFELEEKKYQSSESQRYFDNSMETKRLALEEEEKSVEKEESEKEKDSETSKNTKSEGKKKTFPEYPADELLDKMQAYYTSLYRYDEDAQRAMREAVCDIVSDLTLDSDYRTQVRVYAKAMGYVV